ncbi:Asparaginase/glutaminase [Metarhizium guizhouense ARSEF 977]|uniref:asparaginase n=1 Tax=Metarhizium guizhouense (strain ARSEF 977) TaxID=1276136 RepID=A0A0B4GX34_METGA|nr:Asparaginase/glutaminase [Metarhizium guizhouense ARSEF 977]
MFDPYFCPAVLTRNVPKPHSLVLMPTIDSGKTRKQTNPSIPPLVLSATTRKNVLVVGSGGTFQGSSKKRTATASYECGTHSIADLLKEVPELSEIARIEFLGLMQVASPDLTPEDLIHISQTIQKRLEGAVDACVFIGGSDLLALIGYFLELTIQSHKGVVLLGAAIPPTSYGADGFKNLICALNLAMSTAGVYMVFDNKIYQPRYTVKQDATSLCPFHSFAGHLGIFKDSKPRIFYRLPLEPVNRRYFDVKGLKTLPTVNILSYQLGMTDTLFYNTIEHADGLVLEGVGGGNWTRHLGKKITEFAKKSKKIIVVASKAFAYTEAKDAYGIGPPCIGSGFLDASKSQLQLQLALASGYDYQATKELFEENNYNAC